MTGKKGFLWFVYHHPFGHPFLLIFRMQWFSLSMGWIFRSSLSRFLIKPLAHLYKISLDTYIVPAGGFQTLNNFFIRSTRPEFRQFPVQNLLGSPADSCLELFPQINLSDDFSIKGYRAKLSDIFGPDIADFVGGDICFCRLRFSDYHRFHFFDEGEVLSSVVRNGPLYSVDNSVLDTGFWIQNKSHLMRLRTKNFSEMLCLEVGATNVGSITNHKKTGESFYRGEEKGYFELGGSAVLIVFQKDVVQWSNQLLQKSLQNEEFEVHTGDTIGQRID